MILCANPAAQFSSHQAEIESAVLKVMRGPRHILGAEVDALEKEFAQYIDTNFAIGVANGTDAIELALRALGIEPGDEVITVSHTAVATVAAIEAAGAVPVLVDVDSDSLTLDPRQLEAGLSSKTKAVIAVHLYGQSADLDAINYFCTANKLWLIEDGSQAHGAAYKGRKVGSVGHIGCFSCYPTKNLGAIGDAGLMTTNDAELEKRIRMLREYGWERRYISDFPGRNSRLDELQAAVLRIKLRYLDADNAKRRNIAQQYGQGLNPSLVQLPISVTNSESVFHLYVVQTASRSKLIQHLEIKGVQTGIHYPIPIHLQPAYTGRTRIAQDLRVTEELANTVLSLPMYPELASEDIARVIEAVNSFPSRVIAA